MNTFNRKSLYAALAGLGALSGMGAAEAVNLAPEGLGQALIYPYYTVRNGANGFAYNTLLSVVNTTNTAKAVKVRFLEGKNSQEVLDFNLFLSHHDVWTATVVATADGAAVTSDDNSCILPTQLPAQRGQPFVNFRYSADGADSSLDRTREGYVEIIEMADVRRPPRRRRSSSPTSNGVPDRALHCADNSDAQAAADARTPSGGLFGGLTLINVFDGSAYSQDATALDHVFDCRRLQQRRRHRPNVQRCRPAGQRRDRERLGAVVTDWTAHHASGRRGERGADAHPGDERVRDRTEPAGQHGLGRDDADEESVRQGRYRHGDAAVPAQLQRHRRAPATTS